MSELFLLYLWTRLDVIHFLLSATSFIAFMATTIAAIAWGVCFIEMSEGASSDSAWKKQEAERAAMRIGPIKSVFRIAVTVLIIGGSTAALLPSRNDALLIGGGYIVLKAAQNEDVRARVGRIADLVEAEIEARIAELAGRKEKK